MYWAAPMLGTWSEVKSLICVRLFATPWTVAYQAPSMGFSRQEYWSGLPLPSPEDPLDPGIEPGSPALQADALYGFLLDWSLDHYVVCFLISCNILYFKVFFFSDMRIATPAFFCFPFAWNIFFHPLTFSLYMSLGLKLIFCRQWDQSSERWHEYAI